jgi:hypothetical protein
MRSAANSGTLYVAAQCLRQCARWPRALICAAVLTLALLNPVLCILHCAWIHVHPAALADDAQHFLCNLAHAAEPTAAPLQRVWDGPRAVYELTPLVVFALTLMMLSFPIRPDLLPQPRQHMTGPSAPPPKIGLAP